MLKATLANSSFYRVFMSPFLKWSISASENEIYLTFDDGPTELLTPKILKCLDNYGVKATFFCVGSNIIKHPNLFSEILKEGHGVGNHTFSHLNGWRTGKKKYIEDVLRCQEIYPFKIFRPPYGRITFAQAAALKKWYQIYMWSVLTCDFDENINPHNCLEIALKYSEKGSVVVFHDNLKAMDKLDYVLPKFIEFFLEQNFIFKKL